jgi:chemotaxis methyl-accepting protein methylase
MPSCNFTRLAAFIHAETSIKPPDDKATMLAGRLRRRVRATGTGTIANYCAWFFNDGHHEGEIVHLINAVTTNKTDFFCSLPFDPPRQDVVNFASSVADIPYDASDGQAFRPQS